MGIAFDPATMVATLLVPLQILVVNLLLSADNALVIAMACRGLPAGEAMQASLVGIAGAIVLRLALGSVAIFLLKAPLLQFVAGLLLVWIAVRLTLVEGMGDVVRENDADGISVTSGVRFLGAVWAIIVADVAMSLDNVVAIAAIAQGSIVTIAIGLALSIPTLVWGSTLIRELLDKSGLLVLASGAFLGWVAGGVAVSDPWIAPSIAASAPALPYAVPAACTLFVICQNYILDPRRGRSGGRHVE